jgi:hypothetical protein
MATVDVSVSSDLSPERAWALASNLHRFDEWLTIFGGWKSPVPDEIELGTKVSSCVKVKGVRNTIHWEVTGYEPPRRIKMRGYGRPNVRISLELTVTGERCGSTFHLLAELEGPLLKGPLGALVAKVLRSDVERSVQNLAALAPDSVGPNPRRDG